MPEYTYHPDLMRYAHMKSTLSPWFVRLSQPPMKLLYAAQRSGGAVRVSRVSVPRPGGRMRMLIFAPAECEGRTPCVYFLHGGGFVFGAAPHHFALARELSRALGVRVALPDYRLAPRHVFPAAHEDALAGYRWLLAYADALRMDPGRIAVAGDSAGGNLAAALCLMAREENLPMPRAQMLLYPVLDARMNTESCRQFTDTPMCNSRDMEKYYAMYAPNVSAAPREWLSPAESTSLRGLPAAYIETAEFDCLRDEGAQYAARLADEGVPCEYHPIKNAMHGYDIAVNSDFLKPVTARRIAFLRGVFTER